MKKFISLGLIVLTIMFLLNSCRDEQPLDVNRTLHATADTIKHPYYNLILLTDTTLDCKMVESRLLDTIIVDQEYYLDTTWHHIFRSTKTEYHRYHSIWACNIPDIIKHGDTVLLTAVVYTISGAEQMSGCPSEIIKLRLHDKYSHGLRTYFDKK